MKPLVGLQVGNVLEEKLETVTRINLIKYTGASGDFNSIYSICIEVSIAGLPGIIAHGMCPMGNLSKLFTAYLEEGFIKIVKSDFLEWCLEDIITLKYSFSNFILGTGRIDGKKVVVGADDFTICSGVADGEVMNK